MPKISKKRKAVLEKHDLTKAFPIDEAMSVVKDVNTAKFDASVDIHINLGVDPKKADQGIRGTVSLPNGTGKTKTVLVLCTPDKEEEAKEAGADHVGLEEYITKIQQGWTEIDVVVAAPNVMAQLGKVGRILGPRGLMPNPKTGTVTPNVGDAVRDVKGGKISFRVDKFGIIHSPIGRTSFSADQLTENAKELISTLVKMKPSSAKGEYVRSVHVASTMSPGVKVDVKSFKS